jgi:hypothetical protein
MSCQLVWLMSDTGNCEFVYAVNCTRLVLRVTTVEDCVLLVYDIKLSLICIYFSASYPNVSHVDMTKNSTSGSQVFAFATIYKQLFSLPFYCEIGSVQFFVLLQNQSSTHAAFILILNVLGWHVWSLMWMHILNMKLCALHSDILHSHYPSNPPPHHLMVNLMGVMCSTHEDQFRL